MLGGAGIRGDASGRDRPTAQRPEKPFVPVILFFAAVLDFGESAGDALVGVVDVDIDRRTLLGLQAVFLVPDIQRCRLQWNFYRATRDSLKTHCAHGQRFLLVLIVFPGFLPGFGVVFHIDCHILFQTGKAGQSGQNASDIPRIAPQWLGYPPFGTHNMLW